MPATSSSSDPQPCAFARRRRFIFLTILLASLGGSAFHSPCDARPRLEIPGRIIHVGLSPNLLAPGPDPGTFLLGDLDYGWVTLRRASDGQVLKSYHAGTSTLGLATAPGAREIYAAQVRGSNVLVLDQGAGGLVDSMLVGQSANLVETSADGRFIFATAFDPQIVSVFDREFNYARRSLILDQRPAGLAVTKRRFPPRAYVVGFDRGKIYSLEYNPSTFTIVDSVRTREGASFIALSPDEETAYVSTGGNRVVAIDLASGFVKREIPVGSEPLGLDVSPDGAFVMVANSTSDSVSLIETDRLIVVDEITVGAIPIDVQFVSDNRAYVSLQGDNALAVVDIER
jgi:YVTN family beta-propeller protein